MVTIWYTSNRFVARATGAPPPFLCCITPSLDIRVYVQLRTERRKSGEAKQETYWTSLIVHHVIPIRQSAAYRKLRRQSLIKHPQEKDANQGKPKKEAYPRSLTPWIECTIHITSMITHPSDEFPSWFFLDNGESESGNTRRPATGLWQHLVIFFPKPALVPLRVPPPWFGESLPWNSSQAVCYLCLASYTVRGKHHTKGGTMHLLCCWLRPSVLPLSRQITGTHLSKKRTSDRSWITKVAMFVVCALPWATPLSNE